jgi:plasmid stability protein
MANLSVRKLDDAAYEQLRIRAAQHGVSMEEEARQIIYQAVLKQNSPSSVFQKYFGPRNGIDLTELKQRNPHDPMDLSE